MDPAALIHWANECCKRPQRIRLLDEDLIRRRWFIGSSGVASQEGFERAAGRNADPSTSPRFGRDDKGRGVTQVRVVAGWAFEKPFQERAAEPQVPPLRFAPVGMTIPLRGATTVPLCSDPGQGAGLAGISAGTCGLTFSHKPMRCGRTASRFRLSITAHCFPPADTIYEDLR
jgi:hypothetical protein